MTTVFKQGFALVMVALSALLPRLVQAQVLEWTAHTRGRMIDAYDPGESPEHLLATGLTLAALSNAAYEDDPIARRLDAEDAHFDVLHFEDRPGTDAQAFVVRDNRAIVVAIRGTEMDSPLDVLLDASVVTSNGIFKGAHAGFASAVYSLAPSVTDVIRDAKSRDPRLQVWLTGHSLGGAMAQIYAMHLRDVGIRVDGVVTFGAPAPGKSDFSVFYGGLAERTHRFENEEDIVPCMPPDQVAWIQNGHTHVVYADRVDDYAPGGSECDSVPAAAMGAPFCDAPPKWRRFLGVVIPGSTLSCEIPDPLRAFGDVVLDVVGGRGGALHGIESYLGRIGARIPRRVEALIGG